MYVHENAQEKIMDKCTMTNEELENMQSQKLANTAVEIAGKVNQYVHRECQRKVNHGIHEPYMLEEMVSAYATAMAKFSLYKALPSDKRPTWDEMKEASIDELKIAFDHFKQQMDKVPEHKPCIYTERH
jgi:hypothetical protein